MVEILLVLLGLSALAWKFVLQPRREREVSDPSSRRKFEDRYGERHQAERSKYAETISLFGGVCMERICVMEDRRIPPGTHWHLAHDHESEDAGAYLGPSHPECNEFEARLRGVDFEGGVLTAERIEQLEERLGVSIPEWQPPAGSFTGTLVRWKVEPVLSSDSIDLVLYLHTNVAGRERVIKYGTRIGHPETVTNSDGGLDLVLDPDAVYSGGFAIRHLPPYQPNLNQILRWQRGAGGPVDRPEPQVLVGRRFTFDIRDVHVGRLYDRMTVENLQMLDD